MLTTTRPCPVRGFASLGLSYLTQALLSVPTIMIHIILPSIHQKYQPGQILGSRWKKQNLRWRSCRRHPSRPPPRGIRLETVFQIWEIVWSYHSPKQSFLSHFCQTWRQTISLDNSNVSWSHVTATKQQLAHLLSKLSIVAVSVGRPSFVSTVSTTLMPMEPSRIFHVENCKKWLFDQSNSIK